MNDQSQLMLFAVDSHAKTSRLQEQEEDWKAPDRGYGLNTGELLANYDQDTSSWRTSQHSLIEDLTKFSDSWPRSGMMRNGIAYQLQPLVHLTDATGSGLWLTPQAGDSKACTTGTQKQKMLTHQVLIPTPTASTGGANHNSPTTVSGKRFTMNLAGFAQKFPTPTVHGNYNKKGASKTSGDGLATIIKKFPTPCSRDWKDNGRSPAELARDSTTLATIAGGKLNPMWVEWLMGFPTGWTDLNNSETQLSHKSQNSLDEQ